MLGPGRRIVELGAGSGEATADLRQASSEVLAVEPGRELAALLRRRCPRADVRCVRAEAADLEPSGYDAAVAATALHWMDLELVLPLLRRALRPGGQLAVWRTVYGDPRVATPFRAEVDRIVAARVGRVSGRDPLDPRPTAVELTAGGHFAAVETRRCSWSIALSPEQIGRLFATFSDWSPAEVEAATAAARSSGPVTEHYVTVLHLARRAEG